MDLNKAMIIGRLTRDPELRSTPSGVPVCSFGVATNFVYTNQQTGQKVEQVEYHNVVLWRRLGEIANQYLKKGQRVFIEGRLQTRSWDAQDGTKRTRTEIVADNMIMLNGNQGGVLADNTGYTPSTTRPAAAKADESNQPPPLEELPTIQQEEEPPPTPPGVEDIPF